MNFSSRRAALKSMSLIGILILGLGTSSCATIPQKRPPQVAQPSVREQLQRIEIKRAAGGQKQALAALQDIVAKHPDTDAADDAYIMMGDIYVSQKNWEAAYRSYMSVVNSEVFSPREADALLGAAQCLIQLGRYDEALSLTDTGLRFRDVSPATKLEIHKLRYSILAQTGDRLDSLRTLVYLAMNDPDAKFAEQHRTKAIDIVETKLNDKELQRVADSDEFSPVRGQALFLVATRYFEERDFDRARRYLQEVQRALPDSEYAERAGSLLTQIEARRQVDPRTIGVVLPLTGKHAYVAQKTLQGLQLGLGVYGRERSDFRLAVVDSEGNPDLARRAVERLVTEDHAIAIVGSLLSKTAVSVATKANELGVPSIGLSQKAGLTDIGDYVFRNALTSEMQIRNLVRVAMEERGMKRFAILFPNDAYGVEYANLFWDEVLARGGQIAGAQPYSPEETDFSGPIRRLVGTYYLEDRQPEYRLHLVDWYRKQKTVSARVQPPDDLLPPVADFDAIFIPDSVKALGQIAPMLAFNNVKKVKLLGTNLWNSDALIARGQKAVEGSLFPDAILATEDQFKKSEFYREYKSIFGEEPSIFASQGYDAGLLLRQVIAGGERSRPGLRDELARIRNFNGSVGRMNMSSRRELQRPLVMLTVEEGKIVQSRDVRTTIQ